MVEKRGHEDGSNEAAEDPASKRPKVVAGGGAAAAAAPTAAAAPVSAELREKLEKTKKLLQAQKELQEKLKKLPQVAKAPAAGAAAAQPLAAGAAGDAAARAAAVAARLAQQAAAAAAPPPSAGAARPPGIRPQLAPPPGPPPVRPPPAAVGVAPVPASALAPGGGGFRPKPLLLDAQGREIDERGNLVAPPPAAAPSAVALPPPPQPPPSEAADAQRSGLTADAFFDPGLGGAGPGAGARRRRGGLEFVEPGTFQREAELMRLRQRYGEEAIKRPRGRRAPAGPGENPNLVPFGGGAAPDADAAAAGASDANLVPLGRRASADGGTEADAAADEEAQLRASLPEARPVPDVEWWDKPLLVGGVYAATDSGSGAAAAVAGGPGSLKVAKIDRIVEHPVPIEPPAEAPPPPPQPLRLTPRELKKLRTQRRQAREKEKQELVRQGLLEPPKPKVKISNLMRVLGAESAADPTAIEAEVRKQMAERAAAHDDRNLARMLTPVERREKKMRKLFDDSGIDAIAAVYRIEDLSNGQHRFKVDVNAKENHMSGAALTCAGGGFALVIVEGCPKSVKRYHKLMLRRIDWTQRPEPRGGGGADGADGGGAGDDEDEDDDADADGGKAPNACHLVWEGAIKEPSFKEFGRHEAADAAAARAWLEQRGVGHYFDAAANFDPAAAPLPSAVM